jgi:hypothetical protein
MNNSVPRRRIWFGYPYEMPACLLSAESTHDDDLSNLRADASQDDQCYIRFIRSFGDGTYQVRVAARPDFDPNREGYTLLLTEAHLSQVCPWNPYADVA